MALIGIDVEEARAAAAKYQSGSEQISTLIAELTAVNQNSLSSWTGAAKESFLAEFEQMCPYLNNFVLNNFVELISGAGVQLNRVAANFSDNDQGIASQIGLK